MRVGKAILGAPQNVSTSDQSLEDRAWIRKKKFYRKSQVGVMI